MNDVKNDPSGRVPALEGVRVVDMADGRGELAGRLLADYGADVLRLEPPGGAASRRRPPLHDGASLYFAVRNANKRGGTIDLTQEAGRVELDAHLATADVFIESHRPSRLAELGLDPLAIIERHPHLVMMSITDFGHTGPYRDWEATDTVIQAMGGTVWKAGIPEKFPLIAPGSLADDAAGLHGAFAVMSALWQRGKTGFGQWIDLSMIEALGQITDWALPNASVMKAAGLPYNEVRAGSGLVYTIYSCKGGYVRLIILSPRQWRAMREWLGEPDFLQDDKYDQFVERLAIAPLITHTIQEHFATMSMETVSAEAQRRGIVCTPVLRPSEVLTNEHFASRRTFIDLEVGRGAIARVASGFFELDGERVGPRTPAPAVDTVASRPPPAEARPAPRGLRPAPALPLAGLRVLDFGHGGVGVEAGRLFGEYGADVIKIESITYPDFIRMVSGQMTSPSFTSSSRSKRSFGANAKHPEGRAALLKLVAESDVVIENNSTGTMDDIGLGFRTLRAVNPAIVMVSSQLMGSRGAWANWIGYGPNTQPVGGLVHLWNYDDQDEPAGSQAIHPDHFCGRLCAVGALAGLLGRSTNRGIGAHVEVAQVEAVTGLLADLLAKESLDSGSVTPTANRRDDGAPWGVYPCAGTEQWCVIGIRNDDEWSALCDVVGEPSWTADPTLRSVDGRRLAHAAIDEKLAAWTSRHSKHEVTARLQAVGIAAGPVLAGSEQLEDPHLVARRYPRPIIQPGIGPITLDGPAFRATGMSDIILFGAPALGEHTRTIARELLGFDDATIQQLITDKALEDPPS